jgi:hypothetical protein
MSALELYAKQARQTKGTQHLHALEALRSYMRLTTTEEMIRHINTITDTDTLRTIQEAGARGDLYKALISRMNLLMKEQQEAKK